MPTDKQRREAARRHLERQLKRRADREAARKRFTLIASIVGTLVVIALVIVAIGIVGKDDDKGPAASAPSDSSAPSGSDTVAPTSTAAALPPAPAATSYAPASGNSVTFEKVTVKGAADLKGYPEVTSTATADPTKLLYKDLVVGTGKAADAASSTVRVQYTGVLYKGGTKPFDSSWTRGQPADFSLSGVVPGFTQGIGGDAASGVPPMKVGGRRLIIMPAALGYGPQSPSADIPANSPLVFVVDLVATT